MKRQIDPPLISKEIIEYLEKTYPIDLGDESTTIDKIRIKQGEQRVISHLKVLFDNQYKQSLL